MSSAGKHTRAHARAPEHKPERARQSIRQRSTNTFGPSRSVSISNKIPYGCPGPVGREQAWQLFALMSGLAPCPLQHRERACWPNARYLYGWPTSIRFLPSTDGGGGFNRRARYPPVAAAASANLAVRRRHGPGAAASGRQCTFKRELVLGCWNHAVCVRWAGACL